MGDFDNIRTKPSCRDYRKGFNEYFKEPYGDNDGLPKGGTKKYSMEDLRKERELQEEKERLEAERAAKKKTAKKKTVKKKK